jgi:hypothetical protein
MMILSPQRHIAASKERSCLEQGEALLASGAGIVAVERTVTSRYRTW